MAWMTGTTDSTWKFSTYGGNTWMPFTSVSAAKPQLLSGNDRIQFVPTKKGFLGTATLKAKAWEAILRSARRR